MTKLHSNNTLPADHLEQIEGWGMSSSALSYVYRPVNTDGIRAVFEAARGSGRSVGLRGAGRSYGDASLNAEGITLDLTKEPRGVGGSACYTFPTEAYARFWNSPASCRTTA